MEDLTRQMMYKTFDLLTADQYDDIESGFENLEVVFQRILETAHDEAHSVTGFTHLPAIELHVGELTETLFQGVIGILKTPARSQAQADAYIEAARGLVWDYLKASILFGREIGRLNWPIKEFKCVEAHT